MIEQKKITAASRNELKGAIGFFLDAQKTREDAGYQREREPPYLQRTYNTITNQIVARGFDIWQAEDMLWKAWAKFGDDPFWEKYSYGWTFFIRNWEKYMPRVTA